MLFRSLDKRPDVNLKAFMIDQIFELFRLSLSSYKYTSEITKSSFIARPLMHP